MAKNDKLLIDGIIDDRIRVKLPSDKRDEAFEYFAFEQILKDYDLSKDEIESGSVDGRNDGGIDGFFILINGHLLVEPETFNWPKAGIMLEVYIITCKHHDTFKQAPLDSLAASAVELFDFSIDSQHLKGDYSEKIITYRENLKYAYRRASPRLSNFSISFYYASRGDTSEIGESIKSRSEHIIQISKDSFDNSLSKFNFCGATELVIRHRKAPNFTLELPFIEDLSSGENYILLVKLKDYYNFLNDEGRLRRYLFDSNVRDFMGLNRVNEDIRDSLQDVNSPDFWWLNNGITILATAGRIVGKSILIQDIQIVNGLQTSESIFRFFNTGGSDPNNRSVLVKVIVSKNSEIRDTIIRATNNQTVVELQSLHATDKIQRDIEDVLKQNDLYYERRTNFYKNQGIPPDKIVGPLYLASAYVNLILRSPAQAARLKSRFMRSEASYEKIFSASLDLKIWPKLAHILKTTDKFLESIRPVGNGGSENFLKNRRHIVSLLTISRLSGTFNFSVSNITSFNLQAYTSDELRKTWALIGSAKIFPGSGTRRLRGHDLSKLYQMACSEWGVSGIERIKKGEILLSDENGKEPEPTSVSMEFALKVNELLPPQPWKPGVASEVIEKLQCTRVQYNQAVDMLIEEGLRNKQHNGVVYDENGNVIMFDKDRVDSQTMELKRD